MFFSPSSTNNPADLSSAADALATAHVPVLLSSVLDEIFPPAKKTKDQNLVHSSSLPSTTPKVFMDLTLGWAGHSLELLQRALAEDPGSSPLILVGSDRDLKALAASCQRFYLAGFRQICGLDPASEALIKETLGPLRESLASQDQGRVQIYLNHGNFADLGNIWSRCQDVLPYIKDTYLQSILLDLGVSSPQIDQVDRGFSYSQSAPLDMRMDQTQSLTAREILLTYPEADLVRIFRDYGEEREAYPIAKAIVADRSFRTFEDSQELVDLVCRIKRTRQGSPGKGKGKVASKGARKKSGHPAKQVFQALRIAVNGELTALEDFLAAMESWHPAGAKLLVISFQSLEDRMVKETFQRWVHPCTCPPDFPYCVCGKKPLGRKGPRYLGRSSDPHNPRSESAVLRSFTFQEEEAIGNQ